MSEQTNTPVGKLVCILTNIDEMKTFEFRDLTEVLIDIWRWERHPRRRNLVDYIIIWAINRKDLKGITRMQYIELTWLMISPKAKRACIEVLSETKDKAGLFDQI